MKHPNGGKSRPNSTCCSLSLIRSARKPDKPIAIDSVPNAIMISRPRAPFWLHVMRELVKRVSVATAMFDTGPQVLHHVYQRLGKQHHVTLLPSAYLYPIDWMTPGWVGLAKWRRAYLGDEWYNRTNTTFAVTYWMHTYGHTSG